MSATKAFDQLIKLDELSFDSNLFGFRYEQLRAY